MLSEIAEAVDGRLVGADIQVDCASTDTRHIPEGALFIALKGPNFDAHDFLHEAANKGANALMVESAFDMDISQVVVKDTRIALGKVASLVRDKAQAKVIGLTGSVGKTTIKEMIASILSIAGKTLATKGNLNNDIGVPLTLLRVDGSEQYVVLEMGANHQGEIGYVSHLAKPDVAVINNVAAAHLEGFGDLQGVARAKSEIYDGLKQNGIAVINADDQFADFWIQKIEKQRKDINLLTFGLKPNCSIKAVDLVQHDDASYSFTLVTPSSQSSIKLSVPGKHHVNNALASASICYALKIAQETIALGLERFSGVQGRMQYHQLSKNIVVIDDTYNANFTSLAAAIDVLAQQTGIKVLALGDMAELGSEARTLHHKAGEYAKAAGVDHLFTIGELSCLATDAFGEGAKHFNSQNLISKQVESLIDKNNKMTLLVKGSRSSQMDKLVKLFIQNVSHILGGE